MRASHPFWSGFAPVVAGSGRSFPARRSARSGRPAGVGLTVMRRPSHQPASEVEAFPSEPVRRGSAGLSALLSLQRSAGNAAVADQLKGAMSGGSALPSGVQRSLEDGLGADLSGVRVHTGSQADSLASSFGATAFTSGSHMFFRSGAYQPNTRSGLELVAHEATHTVQQAAGPVAGTPMAGGISMSDPGDRFERDAAATARRIVSRLP